MQNAPVMFRSMHPTYLFRGGLNGNIGEKLRSVFGAQRTRVTWPFAEFFTLGPRNATAAQQDLGLQVMHSNKFHKHWPKDHWSKVMGVTLSPIAFTIHH